MPHCVRHDNLGLFLREVGMRRTIWPDYYSVYPSLTQVLKWEDTSGYCLSCQSSILCIILAYLYHVLRTPACTEYSLTTGSIDDIVFDSAQIMDIPNQPCMTLSDWVRLPPSSCQAHSADLNIEHGSNCLRPTFGSTVSTSVTVQDEWTAQSLDENVASGHSSHNDIALIHI